MSRGAGKTQRAILRWISENPDDAITTHELVRLIRPDAAGDLAADERSLRFAVTRALNTIELPEGWFVWKPHRHALVLFNAASARSYAIKDILAAGGERERALRYAAFTIANGDDAPLFDIDELRRAADGNIVSDGIIAAHRIIGG